MTAVPEAPDLAALAATGATFTSMTGYLHGDLIDPETCDEVVRTAELSIKAAETLGVTRLNLHTAGLVDGQAARPRQRATGQMEKTHRVDEVRKDIARIKTVLRSKQPAA